MSMGKILETLEIRATVLKKREKDIHQEISSNKEHIDIATAIRLNSILIERGYVDKRINEISTRIDRITFEEAASEMEETRRVKGEIPKPIVEKSPRGIMMSAEAFV